MSTNNTREEESKAEVKKESLAAFLSKRNAPSPVTAAPKPKVTEAKTFREIFCSRFSTEQADASTSAAPATEGNTAESKPSGSPLLAAQADLGPPALEFGKLNLNAEEKSGKGIVQPEFKGLKDSRWENDDPSSAEASTEKKESGKNAVEPKFKGLESSRWANDSPPPVHHPSVRANTDKKKRRRRARKHRAKASESSGERQAESQDEPPRVQMDMEEFKQDVEKYGLKTLKDSRWAD